MQKEKVKNRLLWGCITLMMLIIIIGLIYYKQHNIINLNSINKQEITLSPVKYSQLPGWQSSNTTKSFLAFRQSCQRLLITKKPLLYTTKYIPYHLLAWKKVCIAAQDLKIVNAKTTKTFFQQQLQPYSIVASCNDNALFTGYYLPEIKVSKKRTKQFNVPIYGKPKNLISVNLGLFNKTLQGKAITGKVVNGQLKPYGVSRKQINAGALNHIAPKLFWTNSRVDRFFLGIQGSGIAVLPNGKRYLLGYAAQNGMPYTSIGKILINEKQITATRMSMQAIRLWMQQHPKAAIALMNQNKSFIFFRISQQTAPLGTEHVPLTAGYSIAVDNHFLPLGVPIYINTTRPAVQNNKIKDVPLNRIMVAQDTGGSIVGTLRADIYWGAGIKAANIAGHMKNSGRMWILLPKEHAQNKSSQQKKLNL